jgi:regulator of extracellular matrix RemA (YlzA/DUF370 family)
MSNKDKSLYEPESERKGALNVGYGNFVQISRIVAILESGSLPMKRLRERSCGDNLLVDATAGRKTRSLIVTDSRHLILSALASNTLQERLEGTRSWSDPALLEIKDGEFAS